MSRQRISSDTQTRQAGTDKQARMLASCPDEGKKWQDGCNHPYGGCSLNVDSAQSAAAARGNYDPTVVELNANITENEGGIRVLKDLEQVCEVRPTTQRGLTYKDGVGNDEEEIQGTLQAGLPGRKAGQEFGVPVDRKGKEETGAEQFY